MKGWLKVLAGSIIVLIVIVLVTTWHFNPEKHFSNKEIPVIVSPSEPNDSRGPMRQAEQDIRNDSINILLLGIDARGQEKSRTDAIMLARVDPGEGKINMISIPRDTRVHIEGTGYTKINHAHLLGELKGGNHAGTKESMQAVSNLLKCDINYFIKIYFKAFVEFVDTLGGIDITLPKPIKLTYSDITLSAKKQRIDGDIALQLVRERESLSDGDFGRQRNQALVLTALVQKLLESQNVERLPALVKQFKGEVVDINLTEGDMVSLAFMLKNMSKENIHYMQVPGQEGMQLIHWSGRKYIIGFQI